MSDEPQSLTGRQDDGPLMMPTAVSVKLLEVDPEADGSSGRSQGEQTGSEAKISSARKPVDPSDPVASDIASLANRDDDEENDKEDEGKESVETTARDNENVDSKEDEGNASAKADNGCVGNQDDNQEDDRKNAASDTDDVDNKAKNYSETPEPATKNEDPKVASSDEPGEEERLKSQSAIDGRSERGNDSTDKDNGAEDDHRDEPSNGDEESRPDGLTVEDAPGAHGRKPGYAASYASAGTDYKAPPLTDADCARVVADFEHRGTVPIFAERDQTVKYLLRQQTNAVVNHKCTEADRVMQLTSRLLVAIAESDRADMTMNKAQAVQSEINAAKDHLYESTSRWKTRIDNAKERGHEREREVRRAHKKEIAAFERYYDDVDHLRQYSKPSSVLLQIRAKERSMVMCNRFSEAKALNAAAEMMEVEETEKAQSQASCDVKMKRNNMLKRHGDEIVRSRNYYDRIAEKTGCDMRKDLANQRRRLALLKQSQKEAGLTIVGSFGGESPELLGVQSPRTREKYNEFRKATPGRPLKIQPLKGLRSKCVRPTQPRVSHSSLSQRP